MTPLYLTCQQLFFFLTLLNLAMGLGAGGQGNNSVTWEFSVGHVLK